MERADALQEVGQEVSGFGAFLIENAWRQVYFTKDEASIREDQAKAEAEKARKAKQEEERKKREEIERKIREEAEKKRADEIASKKQGYWDRQQAAGEEPEVTEPVKEGLEEPAVEAAEAAEAAPEAPEAPPEEPAEA